MSGNKLEKEILSIFNTDISAFLSINQISKKLNKAYPHINSKVNQLIHEGVLNKVQIGRSYQCSINLDNEKAVALLTLNEVEKKEKNIDKIKNHAAFLGEIASIRKQFRVYTILINKNSLIFVLDHIYDKEAIKNLFRQIKKFDLLFFSKEDFQDYLLENLDSLNTYSVLYSYEKYFELINEIKETIFMHTLADLKKTSK